MMALAREWLLGITGAAILAALAEGIMPEGGVKRVGRLVCGLILLLAVLRPVVTLELPSVAQGAQAYWNEIEEQAGRLKEGTDERMKTIIEERSAAYVTDKAAQLGFACRVQVACARGEAGMYLPWSAQITGDLSDVEQSALTQWLQEDLGIPLERQEYRMEESP